MIKLNFEILLPEKVLEILEIAFSGTRDEEFVRWATVNNTFLCVPPKKNMRRRARKLLNILKNSSTLLFLRCQQMFHYVFIKI